MKKNDITFDKFGLPGKRNTSHWYEGQKDLNTNKIDGGEYNHSPDNMMCGSIKRGGG